MGPTVNGPEQVNVAFQKQSHDPYASTYNPGWRNHPNFSWTQGPHQTGPNLNQTGSSQPSPYYNQCPQVNPHFQPPSFEDKKINSLEKSLETLVRATHSFMSSTGQSLTANTQAIARIEMQMSQLTASIGEREKRKFPSQPEVNPKGQNPNLSQQVHQVNMLISRQIQ